MSNTGKPRVRHGLQFIEHDELNAEIQVIFEDEASALLWAAQWLDEHREHTMTAIRLDDTSDPNDEHEITATLVVTLH